MRDMFVWRCMYSFVADMTFMWNGGYRSLVVDHANETAPMTYDAVHWGMEVNLIKAQIIIAALLAKN
jgi:hypothetical protein